MSGSRFGDFVVYAPGIVKLCESPGRAGGLPRCNYIEWSKDDIRNSIRRLLEKPAWGEGVKGVRCGREVVKEITETYYAQKRSAEAYKGCSSYADFRELLEKEKDVDSVKIMTPDHLHATIAIAAMKKGKHVAVHKPLANRVSEARLVLETARKTGVATHLLAYRSASAAGVKEMIADGAIGTVREVHDWTDRPFWPQYETLPTDTPPIPATFDWNLWLGPALDRPYHPNYTHTVFRGWYDFGGGSIADMGNHSLLPVFLMLNLTFPVSVEALASSYVEINDQISVVRINDYSFPYASQARFKFPADGDGPPITLYWYDGGMRPYAPEALEVDKKTVPATGTMYVGDKGVILGGQIYPEKRRLESMTGREAPQQQERRGGYGDSEWVTAFKGGKPSGGNFISAANCAETICLGGAAIRFARMNFKEGRTTGPLEYDARNIKFTNRPEANPYLVREDRKGWEL